MHKPTLCFVLNFVMYLGVAVFLAPYVLDRVSSLMPLLILGAVMAVTARFSRCLLLEGDHQDRAHVSRIG